MRKLLTVALLTLCLNSEAKFRQYIKAKYQTEYGWSKYYNVEATFMTGFELNKATNTYNYSSYNTYCIIWWGPEQCSIIKLDYVSCGFEAQSFCVNTYPSLNGYDQDEDLWHICLTTYCY